MTKEEREETLQEVKLLLDVVNARVTVPLYTQPIKNPVTKQMEEHIKGSVDISLYPDQYTTTMFKKLVLERINKFLPSNGKIVNLEDAAKAYKEVEASKKTEVVTELVKEEDGVTN